MRLPTDVEIAPEVCPTCGGEMQWRRNRTSGSRFMGCLKWPGCTGTRDEQGVSTVISAQTQNRLHRILKAAVLASDDECLTFSEDTLRTTDEYELHIDEMKEEKAYIVTVREKSS